MTVVRVSMQTVLLFIHFVRHVKVESIKVNPLNRPVTTVLLVDTANLVIPALHPVLGVQKANTKIARVRGLVKRVHTVNTPHTLVSLPVAIAGQGPNLKTTKPVAILVVQANTAIETTARFVRVVLVVNSLNTMQDRLAMSAIGVNTRITRDRLPANRARLARILARGPPVVMRAHLTKTLFRRIANYTFSYILYF
tara:strand:- start:35 stop:622 length:588 start_codon:yes stop_codon:yes gene_type:complete